MINEFSRREFLGAGAGAMVGAALAGSLSGTVNAGAPLKLSVFSKHLHWLDWDRMAATAAEIGFDGIDLTMRAGGHVLPERAEQDLPKVAAVIRKAGLTLPMVTAAIVDTTSPHAESMLRAMQAAGVKYYRWGGFKYDDKKSIPERLNELRTATARLAELNRKYDVCAMYHTHSGPEVGASIWDLWMILKDLDTTRVGFNLDIGHATVEGGLGGWVTDTRLVAPMVRGIAIKDFLWQKTSKGEWRPAWCPLGEGMVNIKRFLGMVREMNFSGPMQMHFEFPLGGADKGDKQLSIDKEKVIAAMRRDLGTLRGWLRDAQLA
ncbi:MAG: sugar phosphate isomerase/epimerase family protein [Blastocatellia bacterium]